MFEFKRNGIHVVKYRVLWFCLSALLLIPGIVAMIYSMVTYPTHSPVKVGIDYTGGTILQYGTAKEVSNSDVAVTRESLEKEGFTNTYIQVLKVNPTAADDKTKSMISVRTKFIDEGSDEASKITSVIDKQYSDAELIQVSSVGPTLSSELFKKSFIALLMAILAIIMYISFRFEFKYAVSAILGLIHDVVFVVGIFSLLGIFYNVEVDGLFLTAILTVIGYSVNDTIVTYDRIRENLRYNGKKMAFGEIVDASVQQTIVRSFNTSFTTFLALAALYFFGGVTTKDFVLAMMLGTVIGTYSSIFFCSMLIDFWVDKENKNKKITAQA
ncbi:protein translocase subunit SecF [bacterium]|nr:protein translocase subunit SecF [bacterium]